MTAVVTMADAALVLATCVGFGIVIWAWGSVFR